MRFRAVRRWWCPAEVTGRGCSLARRSVSPRRRRSRGPRCSPGPPPRRRPDPAPVTPGSQAWTERPRDGMSSARPCIRPLPGLSARRHSCCPG
ncbi:hypothetical protein ACFFX0_05145 [Citricoccus parietis]|uniref:Uncharacterized protein n=1 Tax=Citricoccus parietis TaxID=592307 RepID=A0ABV5FVA6_9MICC